MRFVTAFLHISDYKSQHPIAPVDVYQWIYAILTYQKINVQWELTQAKSLRMLFNEWHILLAINISAKAVAEYVRFWSTP
jgi:hypothetical protein